MCICYVCISKDSKDKIILARLVSQITDTIVTFKSLRKKLSSMFFFFFDKSVQHMNALQNPGVLYVCLKSSVIKNDQHLYEVYLH